MGFRKKDIVKYIVDRSNPFSSRYIVLRGYGTGVGRNFIWVQEIDFDGNRIGNELQIQKDRIFKMPTN